MLPTRKMFYIQNIDSMHVLKKYYRLILTSPKVVVAVSWKVTVTVPVVGEVVLVLVLLPKEPV